ncbi:hypothetical protein [Streptomyces sp. NPDC047928]|uniref:hypothetical protein n=1 Tax=unclassified Streptomyces TaxID=2593676 RepID=UPI0037214BDB
MPRPTAAQLAYGSATVVCSTVAMLLLFRTTTGIGVTVTAVAGLLLGLLVTLVLPLAARARAARKAAPAQTADAPRTSGAARTDDGLAARVPSPRARAGEHSLRG